MTCVLVRIICYVLYITYMKSTSFGWFRLEEAAVFRHSNVKSMMRMPFLAHLRQRNPPPTG